MIAVVYPVGASAMPTPVRTSSSADLVDQPVPASPTSTDGWGELDNGIDQHDSDKEGWDDIEPLEELKPPPALTNIQAAQKRPVSAAAQPKSSGKLITTKFFVCYS